MSAPRTRSIVLLAVVSALVGLCAPAQAVASERGRAGICWPAARGMTVPMDPIRFAPCSAVFARWASIPGPSMGASAR